MENGLFRKKSMERISSPEALHDYMRVTSPRLWMLLGAIAALLVGFIVYASTATMENTVAIKVMLSQVELTAQETESGQPERFSAVFAELPNTMKDQVEIGMTVRMGKEQGKISWIGVQPNGTMALDIQPGNAYIALPDGEYDAELVLESTTPISFLWN